MTKRQELLREAAKRIRKANSLLLVCHVRPDADALGSLLGMALGLEQLGKEVTALSPDGVPPLYRFLPQWERVTHQLPERSFDMAIGMDADGSDRLGPAEPLVLSQRWVMDLDHHAGAERYGQIQVVDPSAAATGELVYDLLRELKVEITADIAVALMAALVTDTGGFRFANVRPQTLRVAAALMEAGAHPAPIYEAVYGTRAFAVTRLLGRLLATAERTPDGLVVWGQLTQADFRRWDLSTGCTEGFVDQLRMVEGAEVALFFREEPDGEIRVSLRSRGNVNVARVAEEFGGGGHAPAAGCSLFVPMKDAVRRVVETVTIHLHGAHPH